MVHALRRAGGYLRRGGMLVSIRPHRTWRPSIAIVAGRSRVPVATLLNTAFEVNLAAAESALERVVDEGSFTLAGAQAARYRIYLARLFALWNSAPPGARIEVTEYLVITVLRRR